MSGGTIYRCPECSRLVIFGQTCTCGKQTSRPSRAATAFDPDAPTVCITHGAFIPCRKQGDHHYSQNPFWVKSVRDYQASTIPELTWEPAS